MRDWMDSIEARTRAQEKYDKEHTKGFYIKLNLHTVLDSILKGEATAQSPQIKISI